VTLEHALTIPSSARDLEGSKLLAHAIYKFSQETESSRKLYQLREMALNLGFDVQIDRRRRAVALSRRNFAYAPSGGSGGCL
jgi:hypothetical protein